jgi:hypothetical protein
MVFRSVLITVFMVSVANLVLAQKNIKWKPYKKDLQEVERVKPGYIITYQEDTIYCLIEKYDEMFDDMQYYKVYVRDTVKRLEAVVTTKEIKMYALNGELFFAKKTGNGAYANVFMKRLIYGKISLYLYVESSNNVGNAGPNTDYLFKGSQPDHDYYIEKGNDLIKVKRSGYAKQIELLLKDCSSIPGASKFSQSDLVKLVTAYNNCL